MRARDHSSPRAGSASPRQAADGDKRSRIRRPRTSLSPRHRRAFLVVTYGVTTDSRQGKIVHKYRPLRPSPTTGGVQSRVVLVESNDSPGRAARTTTEKKRSRPARE